MVKNKNGEDESVDPLAGLRELIDNVDNDVIELLNKRAQLAREPGDGYVRHVRTCDPIQRITLLGGHFQCTEHEGDVRTSPRVHGRDDP